MLIGFRYMTDAAVLHEGWYISEASVGGIPLELAPIYPEADYQVTIVYAIKKGGCTIYLPVDLCLNDAAEKGFAFAYTNSIQAILVVSPTMRQGWTDYSFKATRLTLPRFGRMCE